MIKSKNLFKNISLFLCLVPMLLFSLFCLVPKRNDMDVSALNDEVITNFNFIGANVFLPVTSIVLTTGNVDRQIISNVSLSFGVEDGVYRAVVRGYMNGVNMNTVDSIYGLDDSVPNLEYASSRSPNLRVTLVNNSTIGFDVRVAHSGQLSSDIIKVVFSSYQNTSTNLIRPANYYNTITYYDSNNEYIVFEFGLYTNNGTFASQYLFEERTYYITTAFDDNYYYQVGYYNGYSAGESDGYNDGYSAGFNAGEDVGYSDGYSAGVDYGNDYTFSSLFGAVIDTPVNAFSSLLNFEIFGVNILGLITGLLSVGIIVFIVKLCMGR